MNDPKVKLDYIRARDLGGMGVPASQAATDRRDLLVMYEAVVQERDQLRKQVLRIGNFDVYEFSGGLAIRDADGLVTAMHPMSWLELRKQVEELSALLEALGKARPALEKAEEIIRDIAQHGTTHEKARGMAYAASLRALANEGKP
jgi:hypothetical protein